MTAESEYEVEFVEPDVPARPLLGISPHRPGFRRLVRWLARAAATAFAGAALLCFALAFGRGPATNPGLIVMGSALGVLATAVILAWVRADFCPHCGALAPAPGDDYSNWCRGCRLYMRPPRAASFDLDRKAADDPYREFVRIVLRFALQERDCIGFEVQAQATALRTDVLFRDGVQELEPAPAFAGWPVVQVLQSASGLLVEVGEPQRGRLPITSVEGLSTIVEVSTVSTPYPRARVLFNRAA